MAIQLPYETRIERDESGHPRLRLEALPKAAALFFDNDLGNRTPDQSNDVLRHIKAVSSHEEDRWERIGNICILTLTSDGALIEHSFDDEIKCTFALNVFHEMVRRWRDLGQRAASPPC